MTTPKPKRQASGWTLSRWILIVLVVGPLSCLALVFGAVAFTFSLTAPVAQAGNDFMNALQAQNLDEAYGMVTVRAEIIRERFDDQFAGWDIASWSFTSRSVNGTQGEVSGAGVINGSETQITLWLVQDNEQWRITDYQFAPR